MKESKNKQTKDLKSLTTSLVHYYRWKWWQWLGATPFTLNNYHQHDMLGEPNTPCYLKGHDDDDDK